VIATLVSVFVAMTQAPAPAPEPAAGARMDVAAVVAKVQRTYDNAADFKARFTQTLTSTALKRTTNSSGQVTFKKPGRMRWDYEKPDKSSYITDGGVLWLYEPDDRQAFKQDLKGSQYFGGSFDKLKYIADVDWDLLVIDEAHEGVDTTKPFVA